MENFEQHRLRERMKAIEQEHTQLNHQILRTRQNEQFERELLDRRFDGIIRRLENRRLELEKDKKNTERQLERVEKRAEEKAARDKAEQEDKEKYGRR